MSSYEDTKANLLKNIPELKSGNVDAVAWLFYIRQFHPFEKLIANFENGQRIRPTPRALDFASCHSDIHKWLKSKNDKFCRWCGKPLIQ